MKRNNGSMSALLPLFPLQLVAFPRIQVPLHIFEERYKEMVGEAITQRSEFGIVLAKEAGILNTGCTVGVEKVLTRYPDGRMDILTRGSRRFEVLAIDQEKPYLRGDVEFFNDEDDEPVSTEMKEQALLGYRALVESGESKGYGDADLDDPQLSFQIAHAIEDLDFQSRMLRDRSESSRLRQLADFLKGYVPRIKQTARMRELAPKNGFGHHPAPTS
jgi:ATP-dependent Lon protease